MGYPKATLFIQRDALVRNLSYDQNSGKLVWRKTLKNGVQSGSEAGSVYTDNVGKMYRRVSVNGKQIFAHNAIHIIMTGHLPDGVIDHIDGNGLNNRWSNIRVVSIKDNCKNKRKQKNNTSGISGISWHKRDKVWCPRIRVNGVLINLKTTKDYFEACCTRKSAEIKYGFHSNHGDVRPL